MRVSGVAIVVFLSVVMSAWQLSEIYSRMRSLNNGITEDQAVRNHTPRRGLGVASQWRPELLSLRC